MCGTTSLAPRMLRRGSPFHNPTYCAYCGDRMTYGVVLPHPDAGFLPHVPEWLTMTVCGACSERAFKEVLAVKAVSA